MKKAVQLITLIAIGLLYGFAVHEYAKGIAGAPKVPTATVWTGKMLTLWDTSQERITIHQYDLEIGWQGNIMVTRPWQPEEKK